MRFSQAWVVSGILSEKSKGCADSGHLHLHHWCQLLSWSSFGSMVPKSLSWSSFGSMAPKSLPTSPQPTFLTSQLGICDVAEAEARSSRNDMKNFAICFTAVLHCFVEEFHPMSCLQAFHLGFFKVTLTLDWHVQSGKVGNFYLR